MLQRGPEARASCPGVWVFPGGVVEAAEPIDRRRRRPGRTSMPTSSPTGSAARASSTEEAGVESGPTHAAAVVALDHPRGRCRSASTPASTSRSPRPTASPSPTASRWSTPRWVAPAEALSEHADDEHRALVPDDQAPRGAAPATPTPTQCSPTPPSDPVVPADAEGRRHGGLVRDPAPGRARLRAEARTLESAARRFGNGSRPAYQGPGRVGGGAVLLQLGADPPEQAAGGVERELELVAGAARAGARGSRAGARRRRSRPRGRSPVAQSRKPGLNSSRSAIGSWLARAPSR